MKKETIIKTNAMRMLEQAHIPYKILSYPVDTVQLSGEHTAAIIGISPEMLFKTIVLKTGTNNYAVCCIPTNQELNLKKIAKAHGVKKIDLLPLKDLEPLTGYIRGGCSPIGMKKKFPTYIDETCQIFDTISISSGLRGMMIQLSPLDLLHFTQAKLVDIIR